MPATLYLTSTPIGNYDDITVRALQVLRDADFIICEEYKEARRLLSHFAIEKELIAMNEHNEAEIAPEIINRIKNSKSAALISDCGTPLFSDPGRFLVQLCLQQNISVIPLPGANSLITALMGSGLNLDRFYFYGWLSPKKEIRETELRKLRGVREIIALMETPYRLVRLLEDAARAFPSATPCVLAYELTSGEEQFYRGSVQTVARIAREKQLKGEFVLLIDNSGK
jgi:16S rRNA (cytidine1402-2'-O)-methyltransferase